MIIDLKNIDYYYLTNNNKKRKKHMLKEFCNYNLFEINPNPLFDGNQYKSAGSGFLKIIDTVSNKINNNFKPFVMLEDDIKKKENYPDNLEIPDNCDIFYLGHSKYGINQRSLIDCMYITHNNNIVKLVSMLATHAMMICSFKGLLYMQKCMMTVFYEKKPWDIPLATTMHTLNVYSSTKELMYQYGPVGGRQKNTFNINFPREKSLIEIPSFVDNNAMQFPLLVEKKLKKIKIFAVWTNCNNIFNKIMNEYDWKSDSKYGNEYIFTKEDDFTHAILMNFTMPNLSINRENIIGLAQEPSIHLKLTSQHVKYYKKNVKKFFIGSTKYIKSSPEIIMELNKDPPHIFNPGMGPLYSGFHGDPSRGNTFWVYPKSCPLVTPRWDTYNANKFCGNASFVRDTGGGIKEFICLGHCKSDEKENKTNTSQESKVVSTLPFIEKMSYQLPHISYKIVNNYIENFPKKNKIINYVYSWKNPGHSTQLYRYRHNLGNTILKNNLPIDIYGSSTDGLKKNFPNKENIKYSFDWKDIHKIYENYKFCIVIENTREPEYFSEKIIIALLCGCVPIYLGCTNIDNYFKDYVIHLSGNIKDDLNLIKTIINNPDKYYKKINIEDIKEKIHLKNIIHQEFL
mgnify:CR=1 FL=1|tara:strand:+ start:3359 stop:5239 length:1881 start_codon:yes stop_codon:yes gene_type:complete